MAIESFGWCIDNMKTKSEDLKYMNKLRKIINMVETNEDIMAVSPHMMAVATKGIRSKIWFRFTTIAFE